MMNSTVLFQRHLIPVAACVIPVFLVSLFVFAFIPQPLFVMPFAFIAGGVTIGVLTPTEETDERGTNGLVVMIIAWFGYIYLSSLIFPDIMTISDWWFHVMGNNIINGFAIAAGILIGSLFLPKYSLSELIQTAKFPKTPSRTTQGGSQWQPPRSTSFRPSTFRPDSHEKDSP